LGEKCEHPLAGVACAPLIDAGDRQFGSGGTGEPRVPGR